MSVWPQLENVRKRVGYARVSTREQHLRMQLDALEDVGCDAIFTDQGVSGAQKNRPGLDAALAALKPGDIIAVYKLDRLGRSVLHLADLLTCFHNKGIHFCSLNEGINTTTPGGKLIFHIFSAIAEFQRDMIRENTMNGLEAARKRGKQLGRPRKLGEFEVLEAHRLMEQKAVPFKEMARRLDVSDSTLNRALKRVLEEAHS